MSTGGSGARTVATEGRAAREPGEAADLLAFVREALIPPAGQLQAMTRALAGSADVAGTGFQPDLQRIDASAELLVARLGDLERTAATGFAPGAGPDIRKLRHDLRTPLTAILGYGELVAEEAGDEGRQAVSGAVAAMLALGRHLLETLDGLSAFAPADPSGEAAAAPERSRPPAGDGTPGRPAPGDARGRILVVDDNPAMQDLIARRLSRQGHGVETCDSGEAALDRLADGNFDLVMLDLMMPGIDGLEVLRRLKSRPNAAAIPVIVMSALNDIAAAVRCIEAGADDYLSKPVDDTLLRARIGSSLERKFLRDRERQTLELLRAEQARSEMLLRNILPGNVVDRLRAGESVIADEFAEATVLFCDLVGFTALAARLQTAETLQLLEAIFSGFDALAEREGLEKIKTIGDAYMAVGGIPEPLPDNARRVLAMAASMRAALRSVPAAAGLEMRIGIHTGPAAGGIIGTKKFFYDVWGDTVNMASRLEASCEPGRIHVSAQTVAAAGTRFRFERRAPVLLPGKGRLQTFYLQP